MINNKKLNPVVTELFIRGKKLNISIAFITQSYFKVPKDVRLNSAHFFILKIPNKRELQQIVLNHSSDIDKAQKESFKITYNKTMTIENQIKDEKLQYDINREAAKITALSSGKIDKYEYLTGEEILPSNQQQIIEQAKFAYSSLGKVFEKQTKTIEDQGKKQVDGLETLKTSDEELPPLKGFIPKENLKPEIINEIKELKKKKKRLTEIIWFMKQLIKLMILENLKQYVFLVRKLEIILLI